MAKRLKLYEVHSFSTSPNSWIGMKFGWVEKMTEVGVILLIYD